MNDPNAGSRPYIFCSPVAAGWPHNHHSAPGSSSLHPDPDPFRPSPGWGLRLPRALTLSSPAAATEQMRAAIDQTGRRRSSSLGW